MWTTVISSIFLVLTFVDPVLSNGNGTSPTSNSIISEFKADVHRLLEGARIRKKRQLEGSDPLIQKLKFGRVTPVDLPYLSDNILTFWLSIESSNQLLIGTTEGHLKLFDMLNEDEAIIVALSEAEEIAIKARAFSYHGEQWFAVLHSSGKEFYVQLYLRIGRGLERRQKIELTGFSDMELITMKSIHYLVIAAYSTTTNQGFSYQASVTLYYWAQTQFDEIASRVTYGARSLDCWILDGSLYIAIGQETDDESNMRIGSSVYLYNSMEENKLVLWDMLSTYGPSKVQYFYVAENHYLVFIGRQDAVIYWWSSGQFLEWQSLQGTAYASDISVLPLGDEVAIVIALKEEALFYTLDSSGRYVITFIMSFKGSSLRSLQFMFRGNIYYALALFAGSYAQSIWRLTLESHDLPSIMSLDSLQQCLLDTQELLKERELELKTIKADLGRVWQKESNQTITSKVIVKGRITSKQETRIRDVTILRHTNIPHSSFSLVIAALVKLDDSAEDVKNNLNGVVLKSERQDIRGIKHFKDDVYIPSLIMDSTANDVNINDVRISRLQNALKKIGNQIFPNTTLISNIYAESVNAGAINGISTNDLLLLHGRQVVTGSLTFSDVSSSSASFGTINSIPVQDIVITKSSQTIKDFKTFSHLKSNSIDVHGETNEVDLSGIHKKIATTDNYNEFTGRLTFKNPLTVNGNLFLTTKLNKTVDISKLVSQSVNRGFQQDLKGIYTFKSNPVITGDLLVEGFINKISVDNLLTLNSYQKVYADVFFTAPVTVARDLTVGTVNGVDLSEQVLRKLSPYQFINGRKIFVEDISADFVDMDDYVTLDDVDPSFLVQDIIQHKQGVVNHNFTTFKDVVVLGNVTALNGINGYSIFDLPSLVWLKSDEQAISVPLRAKFLHFKNDLDAYAVNNLNLDIDIVKSYMDEVIESSKSFHSNIILKSLKTVGDVTINGINPKTLKIELDHYLDEGVVRGTKTLTSMEILGNLKTTKLNELVMLDIMQPDVYQTVYGSVEFPAVITSVVGNVKSKSISFANLAGKNLQDYYRRAVMLTHLSGPLRMKHFKHLKANDISTTSGGRIDGVSLQEMEQRVVMLNVPQLVTASKSFISPLSFDKIISAFAINGFEVSNYLSKVVLTDEVKKISHKQFLSDVKTTNAFVSGVINGIKVQDMAANVFYKSENNEVMKPYTFMGDIDADALSASVLDGVEWKDLIFLKNDEVLGAAWFLSNIFADRDIFITGLLNGCDLSQISSGVYTNKTTQVVNKKLNVNTILVVGNLKVKNAINKIQLEVLENFLTTSDDQIITSNAIVEAGLIVDNLQLTDLANSANLEFIIKDAVRHSIPQEITGDKVFKENVNVAALAGGDMFASKLNGIDLEGLYETTVWKKEYREVNGDKIFSSLSMNVASISGFLNGLSLPRDVVRTDQSEYITRPTYFMSDVYITTEIIVHGLIDGVDINELILHRVTLSSEQNISAHLSFYENTVFHDEITIDGTINEIVLELVAKVKSVHPLQGYKVFVEFYVSGPVSASSVNGYNVPQLASSILRYNNDDYINEIQVFEKTIQAQNSLYSEWINSISIKKLIYTFSSLLNTMRPVLGYLQDLISNLQQQLINQLSSAQDRVSKFAYFILFQEINVGPTSRILNGNSVKNSQFSHSLVMWTKQKHCIFMEKCCHLEYSYWLKVKKNGMVMVDNSAESGRYYPISNAAPFLNDREFFIWTNTTNGQPKSCGDKNTKMFLASYNDNSLEIFIDMVTAPQLSDVKSFRKGHMYAIAGFHFDPKHEEYGNTMVYVYDETRRWSEHQVLPSLGVLSLDVMSYTKDSREEVLLALGSGMDTVPLSYSTVYKWNNTDRAFEVLQNIPSRYVTSTVWIRKERDLLLSLASVEHWPNKASEYCDLVLGGQIDLYLYKERLQWIQSIEVNGIVSMVSFSSDGDTYLAAASSQHQTIYIFEWKGYEGFVQVQTISADAQHLNIYNIDDDVYMTIASVSSSSKVFKMVRRGKQTSSEIVFDQTSLEQKDKGLENLKVITGC